MLSALPRPTIFAHRGASAHAPENTLAAFQLAVEQHADAIELDAKLTTDGHVIVIHDQTLKRTTGAEGRVVQMSLAALRELEAGSYFDPRFKGEKIPTLAEVFEAVGQQIFINVELTNYASPGDDLPEKVCALVQKFGLTERVMYSSFNPQALRRAHRILPELPLGLLALPGWKGSIARSFFGRLVPHQAIHPELGDTTPALVKQAHRSGRRVHVYTVNRLEDMQRLFALGVDGIFTDDPLLALRIRSGETVGSQV